MVRRQRYGRKDVNRILLTMGKFRWQKVVASEKGPSTPTKRLVLLTISLFMNKDGGSCFPSTKKLITATGLSERSICNHLEGAACDGWIEKHKKCGVGQAWKRHSYTAKIPKKALKELQRVSIKGTERGSV